MFVYAHFRNSTWPLIRQIMTSKRPTSTRAIPFSQSTRTHYLRTKTFHTDTTRAPFYGGLTRFVYRRRGSTKRKSFNLEASTIQTASNSLIHIYAHEPFLLPLSLCLKIVIGFRMFFRRLLLSRLGVFISILMD
jgi:hypothetical protein